MPFIGGLETIMGRDQNEKECTGEIAHECDRHCREDEHRPTHDVESVKFAK